jgi:fatty acid desaturase
MGSLTIRIPQALNAAVMASQLTGIAACMWLCRGASGWSLFLLAVVFGILMNSVYAVMHEAEHRILFANPWINDAAGTLLALFFPAPFHLLRQGHLGHHMRNRSDDETFDLYFAEDNRAWKYFVLYGILTGGYWLFVVAGNIAVLFLPFLFEKKYWEFDRASVAFLRMFNWRHKALIQAEAALVIALHVTICLGLHISVLRYACMYWGFGFLWSAMQYVHHYGTERDVLRGARNLWFGQPLDLLLLNHNWHRAHHENPTVPWVLLPSLGEQERGLKGFLPWAYIKMWRGPRLTTEHVENRYAGRIIL